jgi:hypothetical protein
LGILTPAIRAMQLPYLWKMKNITLKAGLSQSTLALLMAWLGANHTHHAFTNNDFAVTADLLHRCLNSHFFLLTCFTI